mgnify:CR=1 FL=1
MGNVNKTVHGRKTGILAVVATLVCVMAGAGPARAQSFDRECARESALDAREVRFLEADMRPCFTDTAHNERAAREAYARLLRACPKAMRNSKYGGSAGNRCR